MVVNGPAARPVARTAVEPSRGRYERLANAFRDANSD